MISRAVRTAILTAGICWLFAACGFGQALPSLLTAREMLIQIRQSKIPRCGDVDQLIAAKNEDASFLLKRLGQAGWKNVSADYVASLDVLSKAVVEIGREPDTSRACDRMRLVLSDLHTKRQDCEAVGHSRTNIHVEIVTLTGKDAVSGLEVYWRWLPAGDLFDTAPKRLGGISSPALGSVPVAGEYELFAKDPVSGRTTRPERVSIGGAEVFRWPLPIYFQETAKP